MKKLLLISISCLLIQYNAAAQNTINEDILKFYHQISSNVAYSYIDEMTQPKYKGRLGGTPEYMEAAKWAAGLFKTWGIEPLGDNDTYFQYFDRPYTDVKDVGEIQLVIHGNKRTLNAPTDYFPGSNSDNGTINSDLIFVGFGISNKEKNYDDYEQIDVKNKIVLILADVPYTGNDEKEKGAWTFYNSHKYKYQNAFEHGAKGALLIDKIAGPSSPYLKNFQYASISKNTADEILSAMQTSVQEQIKNIQENFKPNSFKTNTSAFIRSSTIRHEKGESANVIGFIEGTDPVLKNEVILLGAHLDGQGYLGFLLPGALDNASGVTDVLLTAQALSQLKGKMKRSVMFILFGGEECGLLGSIYYSEHPKLPLENIKLMLNIDMAGNGTGLAVWGGKSYPELYSIFETTNNNYIHRNFTGSENKPLYGRPRTDGLVFFLKGIPVVHIGATDAEFPVYYHDYKDTKDVISYEIIEDISRMLFLSVYSMTNM